MDSRKQAASVDDAAAGVTPTVCSGCRAHLIHAAERTDCPICHRPLSLPQQGVNGRRLSQSHLAFASHAAELTGRLEHRATTLAMTLARQGRDLEAEFNRWAERVPEDEVRLRTISGLADWSRQALDFLSGSR